MKNLIIIGARGFGREVCTQFTNQANYIELYNVKGFLDDKVDALDGFEGYPPILSSVEDYQVQENDVFFCALGDPKYRKHYAEIILNKGGEFVSCISHFAVITPNAKIGKGVLIGPFTYIDTDVVIEDFTAIFTYCNVGHDVHIGKFCELEPYVAIGGGAVLKNGVSLHPRSTVLPRITIGNNVSVGVGSIVMNDIREELSVYGNPARPIKI